MHPKNRTAATSRGALRAALGRTSDGSWPGDRAMSLLGAFPGMSHGGHGDVRAAGLMLLANAKQGDEITTRHLVIQDATTKRAQITVAPSGPQVRQYDAEGKMTATMPR
jgi:hypothetical protein